MTFPHSHTHSRTILGFLVLFCEQFVLFSILQLVQQIHVLSINCILPLCLSVQTHTHTSVARPPSSNDKNPVLSFVIHYCRWSHHFMTSLPLAVLPLHMFLFIQTSHTFPLSCPLLLSACLCLFRHISLFFSPPPTQSLPLCPAFVTRLVSITTATFLSCLTIFNQKQRKTEMR